jgi:tetratricopeptide (TPR) repeat protein
MLRQVAYDTLSRRDRKSRRLKVAAHLRATFPGEGEEVADVIARHYLDALHAIPDAPDAGLIRGQAVAALIRAGERADRTGAPALAATSYAQAAELTSQDAAQRQGAADGQPNAGLLWERAAEAAATNADWPTAVEHASRGRDYYLQHDQARAAARARVTAGKALRLWGRLAEARDHLAAALEVLRADPDIDTVSALDALAALEVFVGSPDADKLSTEVLALGQALDVGVGKLDGLFVTRGICLYFMGRYAEAVSYFREAARLAEEAGDTMLLGRALLNLSEALAVTSPAAAAQAARTAAGHLRRAGAREFLSSAITNLAQALLLLGDWDAADDVLIQALESDGLAGFDDLACYRGWVAALRGDAATAQAMLAALPDLRASEDPQAMAMISVVEAFTAAANAQLQDALRHARAALADADAVGISYEYQRWAWPLAVRTACTLRDTAAIGELLTLLDSYQAGHLAPMLRAERGLVRARLATRDGDRAASASFTAAISSLRELSTPYHLAHGLLDHAEYLARLADTEAAEAAIAEARDIAGRLRCQPLLDRADALTSAKPPIRT